MAAGLNVSGDGLETVGLVTGGCTVWMGDGLAGTGGCIVGVGIEGAGVAGGTTGFTVSFFGEIVTGLECINLYLSMRCFSCLRSAALAEARLS